MFSPRVFIALSYLWPLLLPFWTLNDPFFWDTVQLASKHAHFFYANGLRWAALPVEMDSGHPPFLGFYLAFCWTFWGKSLAVSHLAMLPFLLGCHFFLLRTARFALGKKWFFWAVPLFWLDPVMAGQSVLVSPDVALICFFLMSLFGLFYGKKWAVAVGVMGLCAVSMRGMMCATALFFWQMWLQKKPGQWVLTFVPGGLLGALFLLWHGYATGWVGHHADSPWAAAFQRASSLGLVKNAGVLLWRWLDFGRFFEWILLFLCFWKRRTLSQAIQEIDLKPTLLTFCLFLLPSALLYQNLSAHRYLLPLFVLFHFYVLGKIIRHKWAKTALILLIGNMALGNLWVYPHGVSMGWDATLAHLPYHTLQQNALHFLKEQKIDLQAVGTFFPNINTLENMQLNDNSKGFSAYHPDSSRYVLVSNVYNDVEKADLAAIEKNSRLLFAQRHPIGVWVKIFERQ